MKRKYVAEDVEIARLPIEGVRIERIYRENYKIVPRLYTVTDPNLKAKGPWVVELFERRIEEKGGAFHEATVIKVALAPKRASKHMAALTRQSIMAQPAKKGIFRGLPYVHVTFRDPEAHGGKETAARGERDMLPLWMSQLYGRRIRLRKTLQGKVKTNTPVGDLHDTKQVIVLKDGSDEEFIRLFFAMRVFSADQGFGLR